MFLVYLFRGLNHIFSVSVLGCLESRVCSGLKQITGFRHQVHNIGREAHMFLCAGWMLFSPFFLPRIWKKRQFLPETPFSLDFSLKMRPTKKFSFFWWRKWIPLKYSRLQWLWKKQLQLTTPWVPNHQKFPLGASKTTTLEGTEYITPLERPWYLGSGKS